MDPLKSLLVAVSEVRAQASHMCDVAQDLALGAQYAGYVPGYDMPIALADEDLGYDFREIYMPGHPNADERGYVRSFEVVAASDEPSDTQRAYEACLATAAEMGPSDDMIAFASDDDEAIEPLAKTA
jgi:hypothetical protein